MLRVVRPEVDAVTIDAYGTLVRLLDPVPALGEALRRHGVDRTYEQVEAAFAAEVDYYVQRSHEGRDEAALALLRRGLGGGGRAEAGSGDLPPRARTARGRPWPRAPRRRQRCGRRGRARGRHALPASAPRRRRAGAAVSALTRFGTGRLVAWSVLVGLLALSNYGARLFVDTSATGAGERDTLYHWSSAVSGLVFYGIFFGFLYWIASVDTDELFAFRRPESWHQAAGLCLAVFFGILLWSFIVSKLPLPQSP